MKRSSKRRGAAKRARGARTQAKTRTAAAETGKKVAERALRGGLKFANTNRIEALPWFVYRVLDAMGLGEAWASGGAFVSDESTVSDCIDDPEDVARIARKLGIPVRPRSRIWKLACALAARESLERVRRARPAAKTRGSRWHSRSRARAR